MLKKVLGYGVVGLLAVALVGGMVYILARPVEAEAQTERGPLGGQGQGRAAAVEPGTGYRGGGTAGVGDQGSGRGQQGEGRGSGGSGGNGGGTYGNGQGFGGGGNDRGGAEGAGDGVGLDHPAETWITVRGTVVAFDDDLVIETAEGEMVLHVGPSWYWDENGIALGAGDEVELTGFYDGEEFEIGWIENVTAGEDLQVRDETGRPPSLFKRAIPIARCGPGGGGRGSNA